MLDYKNVRDRAILQRIIGAQGGGELLDKTAYDYNGTDQYSYVADNGALNPGNANYSYGCWARMDATASGYVLGKNSSAVGFFGL